MGRTSFFALVFSCVSVWHLHRSVEPAGHLRGLDCHRAVIVATQLRCGAQVPQTLGDACAQAGLWLTSRDRSLHSGDVVDAQACFLGAGVSRMSAGELAALALPVNINAADADELDSLPGVGPKTAAKIIAGRPYDVVDDLIEVRGIGPKRLADLRGRARVTWE